MKDFSRDLLTTEKDEGCPSFKPSPPHLRCSNKTEKFLQSMQEIFENNSIVRT